MDRMYKQTDSQAAAFGQRTAVKGFTLIEIIIVLFIIGLATGIAGIMISRNSSSLELRKFTKEMTSVLRYARNSAVSEKQIYCLSFDPEKNMVTLYSETIDYKINDLVLSKELPDGIEIMIGEGQDDPHLEFMPQGNSSGGMIEIRDREGRAYYIEVNRITGKINVGKAE